VEEEREDGRRRAEAVVSTTAEAAAETEAAEVASTKLEEAPAEADSYLLKEEPRGAARDQPRTLPRTKKASALAEVAEETAEAEALAEGAPLQESELAATTTNVTRDKKEEQFTTPIKFSRKTNKEEKEEEEATRDRSSPLPLSPTCKERPCPRRLNQIATRTFRLPPLLRIPRRSTTPVPTSSLPELVELPAEVVELGDLVPGIRVNLLLLLPNSRNR